VLEEARTPKILPRDAAVGLALQRVKKAMAFKRWSIF
jgi:glutamate dehydrogenase (NAD(P)+)